MFFYFIIFTALGFLLGFLKIDEEQKYGISLVIAIIWGIAFNPIWGIVSLMELALGIYLSTLVQKSSNVSNSSKEVCNEDNNSNLHNDTIPENKHDQEETAKYVTPLIATTFDKEDPLTNSNEDLFSLSYEYTTDTVDETDKVKSLEAVIDYYKEQTEQMAKYIDLLQTENERLKKKKWFK